MILTNQIRDGTLVKLMTIATTVTKTIKNICVLGESYGEIYGEVADMKMKRWKVKKDVLHLGFA